jgi:23S rRNA (uridine2552-2'-O)-methyltransferase
VYKLKEIHEKFVLFKKGDAILDLGAAPGSWTLFALRSLEGSGQITAVDINLLADKVKADNLVVIQGDLFDAEVRSRIKERAPYDAVLCDAAPLTTGNRTVDTARSSGLVELAIDYAESMLKPGGNFAVKIFQGGEQGAFLQKLRSVFSTAKGYKPQACRSGSFETYLVGLNKREVL